MVRVLNVFSCITSCLRHPQDDPSIRRVDARRSNAVALGPGGAAHTAAHTMLAAVGHHGAGGVTPIPFTAAGESTVPAPELPKGLTPPNPA